VRLNMRSSDSKFLMTQKYAGVSTGLSKRGKGGGGRPANGKLQMTAVCRCAVE
jgi:hypothetical protein